jgi:hypothetical protein
MRNCLLDSCGRIRNLAHFIATYPPTALRTLNKGQGLHPAQKNISLFPRNLFPSSLFTYEDVSGLDYIASKVEMIDN